MVPAMGVEPIRCCHHGILNPARLPIPSRRHNVIILAHQRKIVKSSFFKLRVPPFYAHKKELSHSWLNKSRWSGRSFLFLCIKSVIKTVKLKKSNTKQRVLSPLYCVAFMLFYLNSADALLWFRAGFCDEVFLCYFKDNKIYLIKKDELII